MVYIHSAEYLKRRKDGSVTKRADGRYYLDDGRPVTVNDGVPPAGIHESLPDQKPEIPARPEFA